MNHGAVDTAARVAPHPHHTGYRPEIDGLRAIAVLPVILFHSQVPGFSGGFVGVDVFFVISGYLITSIIARELDSENFSIVRFYERRARRILPALFLVMFACLPFAWWLMLPDDLENFGQSVAATTLFSNNVLLLLTSGYFDLAVELKPLLHTWSLGVEEQFYLVYPPLLWLCWRKGRARGVLVLLVLTALSLALSEVSWRRWPDANFYLVTSRFWELGLGGLLALLGAEAAVDARFGGRGRGFGALAGLAMIALSVFAFDTTTPVPSLIALLPVVGTCLVIAFARSGDALSGAVLANRGFVMVGLISYSAYLWHQPLLAFTRIASLAEPGWPMMAGIALLSLPLAYLSWRFCEMPFRDRSRTSRRSIWVATGVGGAVFVSIGAAAQFSGGFPQRFSADRAVVQQAGRDTAAAFNREPFRFQRKAFTEPEKRNLLVLGNSFARDFINAGRINGYFGDYELSYFKEQPNCISGLGSVHPELLARIRQADVVIFGNPPRDPRCWVRDKAILQQAGNARFLIIGTKNFGWNMNAVMRLTAEQRAEYRTPMIEMVREQHALLDSVIPPEDIVDPVEMLGDAQGRMPVVTPEGHLISQDTTHLTRAGAAYVGKILFGDPRLSELK